MSIYRYKVVSLCKTCSKVMSLCKTLIHKSCLHARHFSSVKTCLLSLVGRHHDLLKDMSSYLEMHFYCFYFLCFILFKICLFPRHVSNMALRHDFYSVEYLKVKSIVRNRRLVKLLLKFNKKIILFICQCSM